MEENQTEGIVLHTEKMVCYELCYILCLHRKKVTKCQDILIPLFKHNTIGPMFIYWILSWMIPSKNKKVVVVLKYNNKHYKNCAEWLEDFPHLRDDVHFNTLPESICTRSMEEIYGKQCLINGQSCCQEHCDAVHRPSISFLQICGTPAAWFKTPFNKNIFLSSVRKGVLTYLFLVNVHEEHVYYSLKEYGVWSEPENLEYHRINAVIKMCVEGLKQHGGAPTYAPPENLIVFNWCFKVLDAISNSGMFNILEGAIPDSCRNEHGDPHPHMELRIVPQC